MTVQLPRHMPGLCSVSPIRVPVLSSCYDGHRASNLPLKRLDRIAKQELLCTPMSNCAAWKDALQVSAFPLSRSDNSQRISSQSARNRLTHSKGLMTGTSDATQPARLQMSNTRAGLRAPLREGNACAAASGSAPAEALWGQWGDTRPGL